MEKQLTKTTLVERPKRVPVTGRSRLKVRDMDPNYQYRVVNANLESHPERVQDLLDQGYEIVPKDKVGQVGDKRVDNPSALSSAGEFSVGQGTKAIVMRIRKEYYQEDQAAKQAEITALERRSAKDHGADYGEVQFTSTKGNG
jgi:hypothetical protein